MDEMQVEEIWSVRQNAIDGWGSSVIGLCRGKEADILAYYSALGHFDLTLDKVVVKTITSDVLEITKKATLRKAEIEAELAKLQMILK